MSSEIEVASERCTCLFSVQPVSWQNILRSFASYWRTVPAGTVRAHAQDLSQLLRSEVCSCQKRVKTEGAEVYLKMELGHKTVLQFGEWLKREGFSETVVKIFQGS